VEGRPDADPESDAPIDGDTPPDSGPEPDALPTPDGSSDSGARPDAPAFPFGEHRGTMADGIILPDHLPRADLDSATADFYDVWKRRYLAPGCAEGELRVHSAPATSAFTVSEGQGYGLLIVVQMAGHDAAARDVFDALYRYVLAHPSGLTANLMAWAQNEGCDDIDGNDAATDGDLDIAYALLMADRQWGSAGAINYRAAAERVVRAILMAEIHPANTILVGDWAGPETSYYTGTRSSDFMPGHAKAFRAATAEARWDAVVDRLYEIVAHLQTNHAPETGLLPDFIVEATGESPRPAPSGWLEGNSDGRYSWNACRTPWRLGVDAVFTGDARARRAVRAMTSWVRTQTGDRPARIRDGYRLNGRATGSNAEMAFVAPFGVAAMVEPDGGTNQPWLNALWDEIAAREADDYFGDSIKLLAMILMSGNSWSP
jgi:endo-1,4-beta-D-glucanase Y